MIGQLEIVTLYCLINLALYSVHVYNLYFLTILFIDTSVSEKLTAILTNAQLLKDITRLSPLYQTSTLESFHNVIIHYAPKSVGLSYEGMQCRYNDLLCTCTCIIIFLQITAGCIAFQ